MTKIVEIEGRKIGLENPCFIVGEIGINHNGDPQRAMKMIDAIADAGASCVKFQTFRAKEFLVDEDLFLSGQRGYRVADGHVPAL